MIHKKTPFLTSALTVAAFSVCTFANAALIELSVSDDVLDVGDMFTVDVIVNDPFADLDPSDVLLAFGFDALVGDNSVVSFLGATVGSAFMDDSAFFADVDIAGSAFPGLGNDGSNDSVLLATMTFEAIGLGSSSVGSFSDLAMINEGLFYLLGNTFDLTAQTNITVGPASVPEPPTLLLAVAGMLLLARKTLGGTIRRA